MTSPRDRVVAAALQCFAGRGFDATTINDIERAAGLTPGAGGTYRHFASKRAMLDAAVEQVLGLDDTELAPVPESLEEAARAGLDELDRLHDLMRLLFRDLDQFPELMARVVDRLVGGPYRVVAERTAAIAPHVDAEAVAALMVGALVNFKVIEAVAGPGANRVSEDRLVAAWAATYAAVVAGGAA